jgi:menaquinone-specific isochorismate synthase
MSVPSRCYHDLQTRHDLYHFLAAHTRQAVSDHSFSADLSRSPTHPSHQIVSIAAAIDPIDPLVVLDQLAVPQQPKFYFETRSQGLAIAAIGATAQLQIDGRDRFTQAKTWIRQTLSRLRRVGDSTVPLASPRFFCSFGFFDHAAGDAVFPATTVILPSWQIVRQGDRSSVLANLVLEPTRSLAQTVDEFWQTLQKIRAIKHHLLQPSIDQRALLHLQDVVEPQRFCQAVQSVLRPIQAQTLHKVVLAHAIDLQSPLPFQVVQSLQRLRSVYPDCHLFLNSNGKGQHFIGASPERLIQLQDGELLTDALAGSAPRGRTPSEDAQIADRLVNHPKELHEHTLVRDFILDQLAQVGLRARSAPLRLLQLSNIQHLHTPIHATVPHQHHLLDLVAQLHPTPAVAGLPRAKACDLIQQHEAFARSLYAAPIGWVDQQGNGEFVVGIRSALIDGCHARLYAGAGIVAGSDPDRELAEVQLKLRAMSATIV